MGSTWGHGHGFRSSKGRDKSAHKKARDNPDGKHTKRNKPTGTPAKEDPCAVIALIGIGIGSAVGGWL